MMSFSSGPIAAVIMAMRRLLHLTASQASHAGTCMINRIVRGREILTEPTPTTGKTKIRIGRSAMPIERADPYEAMEPIQAGGARHSGSRKNAYRHNHASRKLGGLRAKRSVTATAEWSKEKVMRSVTTFTLALLIGSAAIPVSRPMAQGASVAQGQGVVTHVRTTSELAAICDPNWGGVPRLEAIAYCQGFLTSFGQYHTLLYPPGGPSRPLFCVPVPGPSVAQSGLAFAAWARANIQHSNEPALDSLLRWAQGSFPCTSSARSTTSRSTR